MRHLATMKVGLVAAVVLVLMGLLPARADVVYNQDFVLDEILTNTCNGEPVHLTGTGHESLRITDNGQTFHVSFSENLEDVHGIGLVTGAQYVYVGAGPLTTNFNISKGSQDEETAAFEFPLIGQGQVPDFVIRYIVHYTVNANGEMTSTVDNMTTECRQ